MFMIFLKSSVTESGLTKTIEIKIPENFTVTKRSRLSVNSPVDFQYRQTQECRKVISLFLFPSVSFVFVSFVVVVVVGWGDFCVRSFLKYSCPCKEKLKIFLGQGKITGDIFQKHRSILYILYVCSVLRELNMQLLPTLQLCIGKAGCHNSRSSCTD